MANKYGPTKSDLKIRLAICLLGFGLLGFGLMYRGAPSTIGGWEAILTGTAFFGGSSVWIFYKLARKDYPQDAPAAKDPHR